MQVDKPSVVHFGFASLGGHVGDDAHEAPVLVQVNHVPVNVLGGKLVHGVRTAPVILGHTHGAGRARPGPHRAAPASASSTSTQYFECKSVFGIYA